MALKLLIPTPYAICEDLLFHSDVKSPKLLDLAYHEYDLELLSLLVGLLLLVVLIEQLHVLVLQVVDRVVHVLVGGRAASQHHPLLLPFLVLHVGLVPQVLLTHAFFV